MNPHDALSPRDRIRTGSLKILHTSSDNAWSLAQFDWRDGDGPHSDPASWGEAVGMRWNGDINNPDDKGNPRSHNQGTWFILPEVVGDLVKASLALTAAALK